MASRGGWRWLVASVAVAGLSGCAASTGPPGPAPSSRPSVPDRVFASPADAETALLELEDRRSYDASILESASRHPDPAVRARAAMALGRIGNGRGADVLRSLLSDRAAEVRASAAFGALLLEEGDLTPELIPLLSDPEARVAALAARAIGSLARGDGQDALQGAIPTAASPEPRATMLRSLWRFANASSEETALRFASDPDDRVRFSALYALSRKPREGSVAALTAALGDRDADAAAYAARALGILGRKESVAPLAAALDSGKPHLVTSSLNSLETILEKNPGIPLSSDRRARILALAGDANPNVALPALVLLRQFVAADREALRRVWSIATTGEGRRRQIALLSVVAALRERARSALEAAAGSPDAPLRAAAAESLVFLPAAEARAYRARLASDPVPVVRLAVLGGLRTAEAIRDSRSLIDAALSDTDSGVRAAAVEALSAVPDGSTLPAVLDAVRKSASDAAPDVPIAAMGAAETLASVTGSREIVEACFRHPSILVRRLARRSLVRTFRADPASLPIPEYPARRSQAEYASLLQDVRGGWQATVETARGSFTIRLAGEQAPLTVANFLALARRNFFDGVAIHRVVPNFVVQDGDPTGTGNGGPEYEIRDENNPLEYGTGTVGMALSGPDTGGSQWFVTHSPQPHLDGIYTVFGQVGSGQDVVERLEQWDRVVRVSVARTQ